jgi:hypothetical protein
MFSPIGLLKNRLYRVSALALFVLATLYSCGGGDAFSTSETPYIETSPTEIQFQRAGVSAGGVDQRALYIENTGTGPLTVSSVELEYTPAADEDPANPAFYLVDKPANNVVIEPYGDATVVVGYRRYDGATRSPASLKIYHNDGGGRPNPLVVQVKEITGSAVLIAVPDELVFQNIQKGTTKDQKVSLINTGATALTISQIHLIGDDTFYLLLDPEDKTAEISSGTPHIFPEPVSIAPGGTHQFEVRFRPVDENPRSGKVLISSNDPSLAGGLQVPIRGNQEGPCVKVEPPALNFGAKLLAKATLLPIRIHSCGKDALEIRAVRLADEGDLEYGLDQTSFAVNGSTGNWPTNQVPRVIPVNMSGEFEVMYEPTEVSQTDAQGQLIPDVTKVYIETNTYEGTIEVDVEGYGTLDPCPTAAITIQSVCPPTATDLDDCTEGGTEVPPQSEMTLSATDSIPSTGAIVEYHWQVTQPPGGAGIFNPGPSYPDVKFQANVAGKYTFQLEVKDAESWSCFPAQREILVVPNEAVHIELTGDTPGDPDQTDTGFDSGADLDLHFVHMNNALLNPHGYDEYPPPDGDGVNEGFFDDLWDTFWFYPDHDWGIFSNWEDNPSLDLDDTDGAGPENLNLNVPEPGVTYKIGVHYWDDHEFGSSTPSVHIYFFGELEVSQTGCPMVRHDMWTVGTFDWPSQALDLWTCTGAIPTGPGTPWPEKPCGGSVNNVSAGVACDQVIMRDATPDNYMVTP